MQKLKVIIIGIVFLAVGIFMFVKGNAQAKRCTEEAVGKVVEMHEDVSTDSDGQITYTYYPIIEYTAGDKTVSKQSDTGSSNYKINDSVTILYNPDNVEEYVIKGDNSSNIFGIAFIALGAVTLVIGIIKRF